MPKTLDMFVVMASKFTLRAPAYAKPIMMKAKTAMVSAMPEALLTRCPAK